MILSKTKTFTERKYYIQLYLLDYINTEQLGQREEDIDERVIENEIVHNIRNFIMTFGKGFSFIGSQVHFDKLGHDHWVDLCGVRPSGLPTANGRRHLSNPSEKANGAAS